jgi:hypothetical protein
VFEKKSGSGLAAVAGTVSTAYVVITLRWKVTGEAIAG